MPRRKLLHRVRLNTTVTEATLVKLDALVDALGLDRGRVLDNLVADLYRAKFGTDDLPADDADESHAYAA